MVLDLSKFITIALIFFCFSAIAQNNKVDIFVNESQPVVRSKLCNSYNTLSKQDLGETTTLNFELISAKVINDSITIKFVLWYCPYFAQIDKEQRRKDCPCNDKYFKYNLVLVKQVAKYEIGEKIIRGKYKVVESSSEQHCINEEHENKLKKSSVYDLIFELDNNNAKYIRLE
jgi:hypothetical protein